MKWTMSMLKTIMFSRHRTFHLLDFLASDQKQSSNSPKVSKDFEETEKDIGPKPGFSTEADVDIQNIEDIEKDIRPKPGLSTEADKEIENIVESLHPESSVTKRALKTFQDWHTFAYGSVLDTDTVQENHMASVLREFYIKAKPRESKASQKRKRNQENCVGTYSCSTLRTLRAGLNRHFKDNGRPFDIIKGPLFKRANEALGKRRKKKKWLKKIICREDLERISKYLCKRKFSPDVLRYFVWFIIAVHFFELGLEFHPLLKLDSLVFQVDETGAEYVSIQLEKGQGDRCNCAAQLDCRMYSTGQADCPVSALKLLIARTEKNATYLFNTLNQGAVLLHREMKFWYGTKPLSEKSLSRFLMTICKASSTTKLFKQMSVRATAIQAIIDCGFDAHHVLFSSDHRYLASVKSDSGTQSTDQKKARSATLTKLVSPLEKKTDCSLNSSINVQVPNISPPTPRKAFLEQSSTATNTCRNDKTRTRTYVFHHTITSHPAPFPALPSGQSTVSSHLLPPKPTLKISRVSQGIVLSWNLTIQDVSADISSYQLFAYQESTAPPSTSLWKKVGDVKALPLPMACTLTQFQVGNKYHFAVRARDINNVVGHFSDPSSIHLTAVTTTTTATTTTTGK